ncbi:MAG TPA: aminomethyl-transferring glycine dehydrogenase subunit GcvPA [Candidatus Kapabacteria bacterium]|nr:aminomethyl-transferring glycine dehydrogenase subunit GcvPA [Candidatus Kapabacteria bacterium]
MKYFPLTDSDREEMRKCLGIKETRELFSDIPGDKAYYPLNHIPPAVPEDRLIETFKEIAKKNKFSEYLSFLGGGAYHHFIPEVVKSLSSKAEFVTPYTPYQPEVSQGSLQAMFEYQTMMTMLTGMDVANASLYDGGTAAAEAALLVTRKANKKNTILIARNLHPEYIEIIETYLRDLEELNISYVDYDKETGTVNLDDLNNKICDACAGFIFQSPNFFGVVEDSRKISDMLHGKNAFTVQVVTEAMSLPFLASPGKNGVDIVVGEAQSFGLPLSYGGPFLGFIAVKKDFVRQMPGRVVGETLDVDGKRGYVLTLSTREQHIKREKATSNICSNEAWCALRAGMYLATMGKTGVQKIAAANHLNTAYFVKEIKKFSHVAVKYSKNFFNEIVLEIKNMTVDNFAAKLEAAGILVGIPIKWFHKDLETAVLINFTELHKKKDIDRLIHAIGELQ